MIVSSLWLRVALPWERGNTFRCPGAAEKSTVEGRGRSHRYWGSGFLAMHHPKSLDPNHSTALAFAWENARGLRWCRPGEGIAGGVTQKLY